MKYTLVTISKGIKNDIEFYEDETEALHALDEYVREMNPEHDDATVYGPDGMVAGAENLMDENNQYVSNALEYLLEPVTSASYRKYYIRYWQDRISHYADHIIRNNGQIQPRRPLYP